MAETEWVNPRCLVNCQGCNADQCCWEFGPQDVADGRQCDCGVFDGKHTDTNMGTRSHQCPLCADARCFPSPRHLSLHLEIHHHIASPSAMSRILGVPNRAEV